MPSSLLRQRIAQSKTDNTSSEAFDPIEALVEVLAPTNRYVTNTFIPLTANGTYSIPAKASMWTVSITTGTGTVGGAPVSAPFSDGDFTGTLNAIPVTTGANSTGYIRYGVG